MERALVMGPTRGQHLRSRTQRPTRHSRPHRRLIVLSMRAAHERGRPQRLPTRRSPSARAARRGKGGPRTRKGTRKPAAERSEARGGCVKGHLDKMRGGRETLLPAAGPLASFVTNALLPVPPFSIQVVFVPFSIHSVSGEREPPSNRCQSGFLESSLWHFPKQPLGEAVTIVQRSRHRHSILTRWGPPLVGGRFEEGCGHPEHEKQDIAGRVEFAAPAAVSDAAAPQAALVQNPHEGL